MDFMQNRYHSFFQPSLLSTKHDHKLRRKRRSRRFWAKLLKIDTLSYMPLVQEILENNPDDFRNFSANERQSFPWCVSFGHFIDPDARHHDETRHQSWATSGVHSEVHDYRSSFEDLKFSCAIFAQALGHSISETCDAIVRCLKKHYFKFKIIKKIVSFAGLSDKVETIGIADQISPNRRFLSGKKRIGRLARLILFITPYRLQCALGYRSVESIGKTSASDDIRKSPLKPYGKGNKRKQDDLDMEEQHSWVTFMTEDLPDEDQDDDPTYEPSNSETDDSEENKSKNDTESDLEVEEKDGVVMLKEATHDSQDHEEQLSAPESNSSNLNEEHKTASTD